jgi:CheY-like chemotaxis protein
MLPVLLIEDEPAVMAYVRAALERNGYSVVCSESGANGLRLLESGDFLGVVSDMRTPGGVNGADVYAWVAQYRPQLAERIVFITGDIANEETVATLRGWKASAGSACKLPTQRPTPNAAMLSDTSTVQVCVADTERALTATKNGAMVIVFRASSGWNPRCISLLDA